MEALVNPIINIISQCLWTRCARHMRYLCKLQENKIVLKNAMDELKDARNEVQRKVVEAEADRSEPKKRTDQVSRWLQRVVTIEGEVEEILQKGDELMDAKCLGGCCPPNNCLSTYKVGKSTAKKIQLVNELKVKGDFQELTYRLPPSSVQDMNLVSTVGMESMFDKVWRLINSTDDPVKIMGLYGQGGVGKTTLLEKINNEFHKISTGEHGFDYVVIFVVVSKPINYEAVQKKIGERLGLSYSLQGDRDEDSRARKIFNALRDKNYVLLLDDIWEDQFDKKRIGIPIIHLQGNSKLIFTTRSERVFKLMETTHTFQVECLSWDKAWSLFQEKVGEKALNSLSGERELAKDVAKECGGLPLALITIGRAMSTKKSVQEWRDAITTLRRYASEFKDMRDKVLLQLKLSYDNLPDETQKSCFRYCSLYPEDHAIDIAILVDIWIAEGFLDGFDKLDEARDRGHTIIGSLKSACLLESNGEHHVKMHDVIRDLALWIVNECSSSRSTDQCDNNSDNKFLVAVKCLYRKWENAKISFWYGSTSPNLLTLIVRKMVTNDSHCLPQIFFQHIPFLRVLDLSYAYRFFDQFPAIVDDGQFPIIICQLHELQYLNLSGTSIIELPVELRKLVKLKFLISNRLKRIPAGLIANLSALQVLDIACAHNYNGFEDWELEDGPSFSELDGLKQLQEVRITITTEVALEKFLCNRKLQMVCTGLNFYESAQKNFCTSYQLSSTPSRRVLDLSYFKSLKDLVLYGNTSNRGSSLLEELVLCGSTTDRGLFSNLETLEVSWFPRLNSILWMAAAAQPDLLLSHFQSLYYIRITGCDALKDLTWLIYVVNLKTLDVRGCQRLETIIELGDDGLEGASGGDQMLNTGGSVFRRLESLTMYSLPKLQSICRHALAFPSIETISILNCPELKKLPLDSGSNVNNTLQRIEGSADWWSKLQWEDETIKSKFLLYFYNMETK